MMEWSEFNDRADRHISERLVELVGVRSGRRVDTLDRSILESPVDGRGVSDHISGTLASSSPSAANPSPSTDYYENVWREASDPENTFIRIDGGNPESTESPIAASDGLVDEVRQDPEYREIYYCPGYKEGREARRHLRPRFCQRRLDQPRALSRTGADVSRCR